MRNPHNEPVADRDSADAGGRGDTPERRCILTGRSGARDDFVRLALGPDGQVMPDVHARAPGRGAWISVTRPELELALANGKLKGALARAFKTGALQIPENLAELAENALRRALTDRLGLELRGGRLILGSDRIAGEARSGAVAALYHASDASADGARKLDQAYRVGMDAEGSGLTGTRLPLDRMALSVALGRDNVVHLALADRASAERVNVPLQRLLNFTGAAVADNSPQDLPADQAADDAARTDVATD
ncbi:MAG: DUF448 domain-containing protein [Croceibacterium sp.]